MGSLISMLATIVLISTVSTLIFATFAYVASRRPQRTRRVKQKTVEVEAPVAAASASTITLQTLSMDGTAQPVPMILVPDVDRAGQLSENWAVRRSAAQANDTEPLFKTFKVEEDVYSSLN